MRDLFFGQNHHIILDKHYLPFVYYCGILSQKLEKYGYVFLMNNDYTRIEFYVRNLIKQSPATIMIASFPTTGVFTVKLLHELIMN